MKREPLFDDAYFSARTVYYRTRIPEMEHKLATVDAPAHRKATYQYSLMRERLHFVIHLYSAGHSSTEMKVEYAPMVDALQNYRTLAATAARKGYVFPDLRELEDFVICAWMVSLGILLEVDWRTFKKLVDIIDLGGTDRLLDRMIGAYATKADPTGPPRALAPTAMHALYASLEKSIDTPSAQQASLITNFLDRWYGALGDVYWHDGHLGPEGGGFFGYWSFEAAAVVKLFGIDDSSFRAHRHYPQDVVAR